MHFITAFSGVASTTVVGRGVGVEISAVGVDGSERSASNTG